LEGQYGDNIDWTQIWTKLKKIKVTSINHLYSHKPYTTVQRRHKYTITNTK